MSTMNCNEFLSHIDEWIEGQEVPGARDHSRACAQCRGMAEDLGSIRLAASTVFESESGPPPRVWNALRAQLAQEGLIRGPETRPSAGWLDSLFGFLPRPALAAAYVAALTAAGIVLSGPLHVPGNEDLWRANTQQATQQLNVQLADAEQDAVASLDGFNPAMRDDLRRNLSIVDNDIALCEKSVRETPDSEIARDYLYTAYQQKADLLAQISEYGESAR